MARSWRVVSSVCFRSLCSSPAHASPAKPLSALYIVGLPWRLGVGRGSAALYCTSSKDAKPAEDVCVTYTSGFPSLSLVLPSRDEKCLFTLRPITQTVGDLLGMVAHEDKGIERIAAYRKDGTRIAKATSIELLLREDFTIVINDQKFNVPSSKAKGGDLAQETEDNLSDIKAIVAKLHSTLNITGFQLQREKELLERAERLASALEPFEKVKESLSLKASKHTTRLTWLGLGLMGFQFGFLARLTWWEYSWDIMEPVTYFVTYGTSMAMFAYYVLTKQEYVFPDIRDREFLIKFHREAARAKLDVQKYNQLKEELASINHDLSRLRDPLQLHVPPVAGRGAPEATDGIQAAEEKPVRGATQP